MVQRLASLLWLVWALGLATPALAQFDALHSHLECYKIGGPIISATVVLDNQFGRQINAKMKPALLCAPTEKTCCTPLLGTIGCQVVPCPASPSANQPAPVDHFKCYQIHPRTCVGFNPSIPGDCPQVGPPPSVVVNLADQFGTQANVHLGAAKLFCVPVAKAVQSIPCGNIVIPNGQTSVCNVGVCPPGMFCAKNATDTLCICY